MSEKKVCKNCGKEFDPDNTADQCRYHPEDAVQVGTADSRYDYADIYKYPCCGQIEFYGYSQAEPVLGCKTGIHVAKD